MQRTGTTSVGQFFADHGFKVAGYPVSRANDWTLSWFKGDFEPIFASAAFRRHQVFEDDPWWCGDFYKVLFHRFPTARFVLFERDADRWYDSMVAHSGGKSLGNSYRHAKLYRREQEYYQLPATALPLYSREIDNRLPLGEDQRGHYTRLYRQRNREVREFLQQFAADRLFMGKLEDAGKWQALGRFAGIAVARDYESHANRSTLPVESGE